MLIYNWEGPEEGLSCACVAVSFRITKMEGGDRIKRAEGEITAKDYIEHGIVFTDPWEATGFCEEGEKFQWAVKKMEDSDVFWKDPETEEPLFTCNDSVNDAIKLFVARKINEFLSIGEAEVKPKKYDGPKEDYKGPCVCDQLTCSNPENPFPWKEKTNGGKFPERCFACSCGKKWWCYHPEKRLWGPIKDEKAWEMLLAYNGVDVQTIAGLKDGLYLLQTIRDMGYIPIG